MTLTPGGNVNTVGMWSASAALLHVVEARLREAGVIGEAGADVKLVEREDGAVEVWPTSRGSGGDPSRRGTVLARCLASLRQSGLRVELVWRGGETFARCRA